MESYWTRARCGYLPTPVTKSLELDLKTLVQQGHGRTAGVSDQLQAGHTFDRATGGADKMRMGRGLVAGGLGLKPPDVVAEIHATRQPRLGQIGQVAKQRGAVPQGFIEQAANVCVRQRRRAAVQGAEHGDTRWCGPQPCPPQHQLQLLRRRSGGIQGLRVCLGCTAVLVAADIVTDMGGLQEGAIGSGGTDNNHGQSVGKTSSADKEVATGLQLQHDRLRWIATKAADLIASASLGCIQGFISALDQNIGRDRIQRETGQPSRQGQRPNRHLCGH